MKPGPRPGGAGRSARHAKSTQARRQQAVTAAEELAATTTASADADLVGFTADELRVLATVATLAPALSPSAPARERMRTRLLAGAAAAAVQDAVAEAPEVVELARRRRGARGTRGRFLIAAAAALGLVVALGGISLALSRGALPGDVLYSLKRVGESTQLGLTFGETNRGVRHLDNATHRVDELGELVARGRGEAHGTGGISSVAVEQVDPVTVTTLMDGFDTEAESGSRLLTTDGVAGDTADLGLLAAWAQGQSARLTVLRSSLTPLAQTRLDRTQGVLEQVRVRATTLGARVACSPITTGATDDLGPLPAAACAGPVTAEPSSPAGGTAAPTPQPGTSTTGDGPGRAGPPTTGGAVTTTAPAPAPPRLTAPTLPAPDGAAIVPALPGPAAPSASSVPPPITIGPILPGLPTITVGG